MQPYDRKAMKEIAKEKLRGSRGTMVLVTLIYALLVTGIPSILGIPGSTLNYTFNYMDATGSWRIVWNSIMRLCNTIRQPDAYSRYEILEQLITRTSRKPMGFRPWINRRNETKGVHL